MYPVTIQGKAIEYSLEKNPTKSQRSLCVEDNSKMLTELKAHWSDGPIDSWPVGLDHEPCHSSAVQY